ncbi:YihY/virulence factor BrkB family protein [Acetivibrio saccincola]|jgi:membrane protein|uniref:YihY/virulence factor BrkB family protein n=1 Tax=Acetivibrio saccincola TaxID=1677857 RepID=UPI001692EC14|nr:YihY/virulence factor BrkB family protein [Acetivibrio saccincola]NLW27469.1 YihY/virulence factor BrkB family protein [Acetivibrio saccincola]
MFFLNTNNTLFAVIKRMYSRFKDNNIPAFASQLTYSFILSFFPFLIFLLTLISYTPVNSEKLMAFFSDTLPQVSYNIVLNTINQAIASRQSTLLPIGMITTIWMSSNGMNAVISGLNKAFNQKESRPFWKVRGISIIATLFLAIAILFSLVLLVFGEIVGKKIFQFLGVSRLFIGVWNITRYIITFSSMTIVFSLLYRFTPNNPPSLKEVIPGAIFSTSGWIIVSLLFSIYVNNYSNYSNMYGGIGGIIILLIWLYWISVIILLGGELNASLISICGKDNTEDGKRK